MEDKVLSKSSETIRKEEKCPNCGAVLIEDFGYVTWCDKCNWNLQPEELYRPANFFEILYIKLGRKNSINLFNKLIRKSSLNPAINFKTILAFIISGIVYAINLGFLIFGIFFFIKGADLFVYYLVGLIFIGIAWVIKPKIVKFKEKPLPRDEYKNLYTMVDNISQAIGASNIDGIIIDHKFNASFGRMGWRRKRILYIGLPIFSILDDQEKVALITHELTHDINKDNAKGFFIGTAVNSLITLYELLKPPFIFNINIITISILLLPYHIIQFVVARFIWLMSYVLCHLLWSNSQEAEYLADNLSANICGTESMVSMIEKLYYGNMYGSVIQKVSLSQDSINFFDEFKTLVSNIPEKEKERIKRLEKIEDLQLNATHPPTFLRMQFLKDKFVKEHKSILSKHEFQKIDNELKCKQEEIQNILINIYRYYIS